jgi:hypothetical protein
MRLRPLIKFLSAFLTFLASVAISSPLRARADGFEVGNGVAISNGMASVVFNLDKGARFSVIPNFPIGLLEIQVSYTDGTLKRTSMLYAGNLSLKTPMTVEMTEVVGVSLLLAIVLGFSVFLSSKIKANRELAEASLAARPDTSPPALGRIISQQK